MIFSRPTRDDVKSATSRTSQELSGDLQIREVLRQ